MTADRLTCADQICCRVRRSQAATTPSSVPVTSSCPDADADSAHTPDSRSRNSSSGSGSVLLHGCRPSATSHTLTEQSQDAVTSLHADGGSLLLLLLPALPLLLLLLAARPCGVVCWGLLSCRMAGIASS